MSNEYICHPLRPIIEVREATGSPRSQSASRLEDLVHEQLGENKAGEVTFWDVAGRKVLKRQAAHEKPVLPVAFPPDGKTLASASEDHSIVLGQVATLQQLFPLIGHLTSVRSVAFSPDSKMLASACHDGSLFLWRGSENMHEGKRPNFWNQATQSTGQKNGRPADLECE